MDEPHVPVLAEAVVRYAVPSPGERAVIDCTVGAGGHAAALLRAMGPAGRLLGIDRDPDALRLAADRLAPFGDQVRLVHANFAELGEIVTQSGWGPSDAVVYDFGLSSMHVDRPERGFSYQHDAPLDPHSEGMPIIMKFRGAEPGLQQRIDHAVQSHPELLDVAGVEQKLSQARVAQLLLE